MNRRRITGVVGLLATAGIALGATSLTPAGAVPANGGSASPGQNGARPARPDDRPDPLSTKRNQLKRTAVDAVASGDATVQTRGGGKVVHLAHGGKGDKGQWVEYGTQQTAQLLTFLVQFGDNVDPRYPDSSPGPKAGQMPQPGADDNSTYWLPSFDREHYLDMFFKGMPEQNGESFHQFYKEMSSGRFDLQGDVSDWVTIPDNEASFGETESNKDMTRFVQETANAWYDQQIASGKTKEQVEAYLQSFDQWDRFDLDGDGNYNEPDGYIDHFQAIHAGPGEEAGAPEEAIWSHRWAVNPAGSNGPAAFPHAGGIRIGDTDLWIRDYTTEPENGGLGVFSHEFGHDLGLPDFYDTAGGDNGTGFWTLMSAGSWLNHGQRNIGTTPGHMGATEKLFLGWLDHATVDVRRRAKVTLGPSYHATGNPQAVLVRLPDGHARVTVGSPYDGKYLYSGTGDDYQSTMAGPAFTVPTAGQLTAKAKYSIETDYDYAYVEVSTDGGATYTAVPTNLSNSSDPNNPAAITGNSADQWVDLTADLSAYAGQQVRLRFRYVTDGGYHEVGLLLDDIAVGSALTQTGDDTTGWTMDGWQVIDGDGYEQAYTQYYLAENRQYKGYDVTLKQGPYNFGWRTSLPNKVEHFPYQNGLLVTYVNGLYADNNTSGHAGTGYALPVDAHATALRWSDGKVVGNRIQPYDATFGLQRTDPLALHSETPAGSRTLDVPARAAVPVFDDTDPSAYYDPANPWNSAIVAGTGTTIRVTGENDDKGTMTLQVN